MALIYWGIKTFFSNFSINNWSSWSIIFSTVNAELLKLDIEGSEGKIFQDIGEKFGMIENSIMEYHYQSNDSENKLSEILKIIENHNHEYHISAIDKSTEIKSVSCYMIKTMRVQ